MWALPVLRTRSYLGAVEFHAHAASSGSLSPRDLYSVNLGSVFRCETFIRPPSSRERGLPTHQRRRESEKDGRRSPAPWLKVFVECVICIERAGAARGAGRVRKRWQLPSTPGVILPQATAARATYQASQFFPSTAPHATHSLSPCQHEKSPLINYCFLLHSNSLRRAAD